MFWFRKKRREQIIKGCINELSKEFMHSSYYEVIKDEIVRRSVDSHYYSYSYLFDAYDVDNETSKEIKDRVLTELVDRVVKDKEREVLESLSKEDFSELVRKGIEQKYKELMK